MIFEYPPPDGINILLLPIIHKSESASAFILTSTSKLLSSKKDLTKFTYSLDFLPILSKPPAIIIILLTPNFFTLYSIF